jgi:nucleotide-binding universal stress UspA family protein
MTALKKAFTTKSPGNERSKVMCAEQKKHPLNILLGIDGSEHSQAAVELLCDLPAPSQSKVLALAVFSPRQLEKHAMLQDALNQTQSRLVATGWQIETELKAGNPAETLLEYAELKKSDMIVIGAIGLRATLGILLGGVAQQIVEYGRWPVLVVRSPYLGLKKVLLATDGSQYSQIACNFFASFPWPEATAFHLIHVLAPVTPATMAASAMIGGAEPIPAFPAFPTSAEATAWQKEEEEKGQAILDQSLKTLQENGLQARCKLMRGDAATEIIAYARHNQIDLIISGSRGLSTMAGWMLGSVSRKLIHYSACSVLVVRGLK